MRTITRTSQFDEFYDSLPLKVQAKVDYALNVMVEITVISTKLVKRLVDTDFYELRISMDNEYRVILFTIDHENLIESTQILLLNGFVKKSTKDYRKQIDIADKIIKTL
jgi:phage-related protein